MITTVFVLIAVYTTTPFWGPTKVHVDSIVFETAERCLRNLDLNEKSLKKESEDVYIKCEPRTVETGK